MSIRKFVPIRTKVFMVVIPGMILVTLVTVSVVLFKARSALFVQLERRAIAVAKNYAASAVFAVATGDTGYIDRLTKRFFDDPDVIAVVISGADNKVVYENYRSDAYRETVHRNIFSDTQTEKGAFTRAGIVFAVESLKIQAGGEEGALGLDLGERNLGRVFVIFSTTRIKKDFAAVLLFSLIVVAVFVAGGAGTAAVAIGRIFQPVREIVTGSQSVARGDLTVSLGIETNDEIGILAENFNRMVEQLRSVIQRMTEIASSISKAVTAAREISQTVTEGSMKQKDYIQEIEISIDNINTAAHNIAENTEILNSSAEESASAILEMNASVEEAAENMERLSGAVDETTVSIQEMAASIKQVADNIVNLMSALQDTAKAVEAIDENISQIERNADEMARSSERVRENAGDGEQSLRRTKAQMDRIKVTVTNVNQAIDVLSDRVGEIGKIVNVIDDIAEQTNLLALNAAIIAAQSGERGKGFSVVADNIKELSDRTSESTKEINALIEGINEEMSNVIRAVAEGIETVEEGVKMVSEASELLTEITRSAEESYKRSVDIARSTKEQARASSDAAKSTKVISEMAMEIQRAINEQAKGSDMIRNAAERMKEISDFVKGSMTELLKSGRQVGQLIENISEMVKFIAEATKEQSGRTKVVSEKVDEILNVSDKNIEVAQNLRKSVEELMDRSTEMGEITKTFKIRRKA